MVGGVANMEASGISIFPALTVSIVPISRERTDIISVLECPLVTAVGAWWIDLNVDALLLEVVLDFFDYVYCFHCFFPFYIYIIQQFRPEVYSFLVKKMSRVIRIV